MKWAHREFAEIKQRWEIRIKSLFVRLHPLPIIIFFLGCVLGALIAAAQLLPTLELSPLGLRSGGLDYYEASSFSLKPLQILWTLLPSYGLADLGVVFETLGYTEYVAYVGVVALLLALFALVEITIDVERLAIFARFPNLGKFLGFIADLVWPFLCFSRSFSGGWTLESCLLPPL